MRTTLCVTPMVILTSLGVPALAQEVSIPDPGLNAAIRTALQKPNGPLTEQDLLSLTGLDASGRSITSVEGLEAARNLIGLRLDSNSLTNFALVGALTNLTLSANLNRLVGLILDFNHLRSLPLPAGLTNLSRLTLLGNQLTNLTVPADMTKLEFLDVGNNQLPNFALPADLTRLTFLRLSGNQLTNITLPPDVQQLTALVVDGNPLATLVLSEALAATNLAGTVTVLRNQGVSVFTYPLAVSLISPRLTAGAFELMLTGPPGIYTVLASADLAAWSELGAATNLLGSAIFTDMQANLSPQRFFRARSAP